MITNLFSSFDPSSSIFSISWCVVIFSLVIFSTKLWKISSVKIKLIRKLIRLFKKEVSFTLGKFEKSSNIILLLIFVFIISMNFIALFPQVFSLTSHLAITLPISILFWLSLIIFGWINNRNHILSHLLPQGTPRVLIIFIVLIELIRNLIRPITLCVRLTANLIAGHLLITLLGNALINLNFFKILFLFNYSLITNYFRNCSCLYPGVRFYNFSYIICYRN